MAIEAWRSLGPDRALVWRYGDPYDDELAGFDCGREDMNHAIRYWGSSHPPNQFEVLEFGIEHHLVGIIIGRITDWPDPSSGRSVPTYVIVAFAIDLSWQSSEDPVSGQRLSHAILDRMVAHVQEEVNPTRSKNRQVVALALQADTAKAKHVYERNQYDVIWEDGGLTRMRRAL